MMTKEEFGRWRAEQEIERIKFDDLFRKIILVVVLLFVAGWSNFMVIQPFCLNFWSYFQ